MKGGNDILRKILEAINKVEEGQKKLEEGQRNLEVKLEAIHECIDVLKEGRGSNESVPQEKFEEILGYIDNKFEVIETAISEIDDNINEIKESDDVLIQNYGRHDLEIQKIKRKVT